MYLIEKIRKKIHWAWLPSATSSGQWVGGYLFSLNIGTLLVHLSYEAAMPLFSIWSLARAWLIHSEKPKDHSNKNPEFSGFRLILGELLTGGHSLCFLPFLTLSGSVSLTMIPSNDSKGLGIVTVISQRTVE